jgi:hypothetical protein
LNFQSYLTAASWRSTHLAVAEACVAFSFARDTVALVLALLEAAPPPLLVFPSDAASDSLAAMWRWR